MATRMARWDGDARGEGIADGAWLAGDVRRFLAALEADRWVAEDADAHLLPHLRRACAEAGSPWALQAAEMVDAVYVVTLEWSAETPSRGRLRADVFALLGAIAESATYVRQRVADGAICYDIATGMLDDDSPFRPHGHLVQFRIGGEAARAMAESTSPVPGGNRT